MAGSPGTTPLHALHLELGARMVPFAGTEMPVQYPTGTLAEHAACREAAALFDVSHMGQVTVTARSGNPDDAALALERILPIDVLGLAAGRQRYGYFTLPDGGLLDDLMVSRIGDTFHLVVNAVRKADDLAHLNAEIGAECEVVEVTDRGLLAVQGPAAEALLAKTGADTSDMRFLDVRRMEVAGHDALVARSGYTGEDGFEISLPADALEAVARQLIAEGVVPAGLGARDSLRVEAGLCLYGAEISIFSSPIEAGLGWAIQKVRRRGGARAGGFPGAERILSEIEQGTSDVRVGLRPEGKAPVRSGTNLFASEEGGEVIGGVTSGLYGATIGGPVAMGYVPRELAAPGTRLYAEVRGKRLPVNVAALPFTPAGFKR